MEITSYLLGKKAGGGSTPTGTIDITQNGITNVSGYATANVQVPEKQLEEKSVTISSNTTTLIEPSTGKDGMSSVSVTTNIPEPSGKITITQNGTDIDVSSYASADVSVGGSVPTTVAEFEEQLQNLADSFCQYLDTTLIEERTAYTNQSVTLYTPDIDCKFYVIRKRSNVYSVIWGNNKGVYGTGSTIKYCYPYIRTTTTGQADDTFEIENGQIHFNINVTSASGGNPFKGYFSNETFSTPEEAVQAIINNQITYNLAPANDFGMSTDTPFMFPYSNCTLFSMTTDSPISIQSKIISHNETIVAIS